MHEIVERAKSAVVERPLLSDVALALLLAGIEAFYIFYYLGLHECDCDLSVPWAIAIALLTTLPLIWRRRSPFLVVSAAGTATFVGSVLEVPLLGFGALVAVFTVASLSNARLRLITLIIVVLAVVTNPIIEGDYQAIPEDAVMFGSAWVLGTLARTRRAYTEELEAKAERLEHEREERARLAVAEERGTIARELHDIVAHGVTAMVIQAEAARSVMKQDPESADRALQNVEAVGRSNLEELRRLLGILRSNDEGALLPTAGLDKLAELLESAKHSGLDVDLDVTGSPRSLPVSTDLSTYRIIQESLTNALKHSSEKRARVELDWRRNELVVTVSNPAPATPIEENGRGGHGIPGMRERAALVGGTLDVKRDDRGDNVVQARLPLGET